MAALARVECRPVTRGRAAVSLATTAAAAVLVCLLFARVAAAFLSPALPSVRPALRQPPPLAQNTAAARLAGICDAGRRPAIGARMCADPAPVDPALATVLLHLGVARALSDLERLGHGVPRGGASRVVVRAGRVVPDPRDSWQAAARRRLRRAQAAAQRPGETAAAAAAAAAAVVAARVNGAHGTVTLVRDAANEAVSFILSLSLSLS
jgi:hypothetical protein